MSSDLWYKKEIFVVYQVVCDIIKNIRIKNSNNNYSIHNMKYKNDFKFKLKKIKKGKVVKKTFQFKLNKRLNF